MEAVARKLKNKFKLRTGPRLRRFTETVGCWICFDRGHVNSERPWLIRQIDRMGKFQEFTCVCSADNPGMWTHSGYHNDDRYLRKDPIVNKAAIDRRIAIARSRMKR